MPDTPGLFISFEGIDGAGKSTHIEAIQRALEATGREVLCTREPGGTPLAEHIREMVLHTTMDPLSEVLLVFAARRDHLLHCIAPALRRGAVVLCDRFSDASFAYQSAGRGCPWEVLQTLEAWVMGAAGAPADADGHPHPMPHTTLWFDLPPSVAAQRLALARVPDRFESQPQAFFEQVAQGYARRCVEDPRRFVRINADQPAEVVRRDVLQAMALRGYLPA